MARQMSTGIAAFIENHDSQPLRPGTSGAGSAAAPATDSPYT
jgi:hypothetical protein